MGACGRAGRGRARLLLQAAARGVGASPAARRADPASPGYHPSVSYALTPPAALGGVGRRAAAAAAGPPRSPAAPERPKSLRACSCFPPLTKIPPSLSSIQWLGALRRFRCFFGPRTILPQLLAVSWAGTRRKEGSRGPGAPLRPQNLRGRRPLPPLQAAAGHLQGAERERGTLEAR